MTINTEANETEEQIIGRLEAEISPLHSAMLRRTLRRQGHLDMYMQGEYQWADLVDIAADLDATLRDWAMEFGVYSGPRPGRTRYVARALEPTTYEKTLAAARASYFGMRAARRSGVAQFREEVLGGRLLSAPAARALLTSPAAAFMPLGWFRSRGVPLIGHTAHVADEVRRQKDGRYVYTKVFQVEPPRKTFRIEQRTRGGSPLRMFPLHFVTDEGDLETVWVTRVSVLYHLQRLANSVAGSLRTDEASTAHFILTGTWVEETPVRVRVQDGIISLDATPWASEKTVRDAFLAAQREVRGGDNSRLKLKTIKAFLFVIERCGERGESPSWETLREMWNAAYPQDRYSRREDLYRAFVRARKVLLPNARDGSIQVPQVRW